MIKISTGLADAMMGNTGMTQALNDAELELRIFSGPEPVSADVAIENEVLLVTIAPTSGTMQFNHASGLVMKDIDQSWLGSVVATGTPTYYRLCATDDDNSQDANAIRVQGSVGAAGDLKLGTNQLTVGNPQGIDFYQLRLPQFMGA